MNRVIKINLDSGINDAIKELEDYKTELYGKLEAFISGLVSSGVQVASACVAGTKGDSDIPDVTYEVDAEGEIVKAQIAIVGNDVLFVEFGSGIQFNPSDHPQAAEFGYGIGTYPSEHPPNRAIFPGYWYYGDGRLSVGTQATMPIYNASESMRNEIIQKAVEAFRS